MTWCLSHITEEQMKKVIEYSNKENIPGFVSVVESPKFGIIRSGEKIILVNAPEENLGLHKAMNK